MPSYHCSSLVSCRFIPPNLLQGLTLILANDVKVVEGLHDIEASGKDDSVKVIVSDSTAVVFADSSNALGCKLLELVCDQVDMGQIEGLCGVKIDAIIT